MKKTLLLLSTLFLFSCSDLERSRMRLFDSMESPIVVFAESQTAIILIDKKDNRVYFDNTDKIGTALMESYNLGDTLINLK